LKELSRRSSFDSGLGHVKCLRLSIFCLIHELNETNIGAHTWSKEGGIRPGGGVAHICFESVCFSQAVHVENPRSIRGQVMATRQNPYFLLPMKEWSATNGMQSSFCEPQEGQGVRDETGRNKTWRWSGPHLCSMGGGCFHYTEDPRSIRGWVMLVTLSIFSLVHKPIEMKLTLGQRGEVNTT
jgi:hypothetical protein